MTPGVLGKRRRACAQEREAAANYTASASEVGVFRSTTMSDNASASLGW